MLLSSLQILTFVIIFGSVSCTNDESNPTPVYVVQGRKAVLQCGFESSELSWRVYDGGSVTTVAIDGVAIDDSKYSVSKNPSTGLYYRLHILNVVVSDIQKYKCQGLVNGVNQYFYIQLYFLVLPSRLTIENATTQNKLLGTEGQDLTVSCKAVGGTPAPNVMLIIDEQPVANQTQRAQYTLTDINRSYDHKTVTCLASNEAYSQDSMTVSVVMYINFAPIISVSDVTYEENEATRTVACLPVGNPSRYTYYKWQHKSTHGVLIRELDGGQDGVLLLPSIPVEDRYQDSGEYICTAGNGIVGRDGKVKQTGSGYATINAQPIFTNDNILTQYGEFGEKAIITVYVYSVPKYSTSRWYKSNTQVQPSTKYVMSERPAIVNNIFHGKTIQLDGYSVMLIINDLIESDFNDMYTLTMSYGASQTVQYSVSLKSCVIPELSECFILKGVNGGLAGVIVVLIIIIVGLLCSRKSERRHNTRSNRSSINRQSLNMDMPDIYTEVADIQDPIPIDTSTIDFEPIGQRDKPNVHEGLKRKQEPTPIDTSTIDFEPIGQRDKPNVHEGLKRKQEPIPIDTSTIDYESLGKKDKPNVYKGLENKQEPIPIDTSTIDYESLGKKDKPNVYEGIKNKQDAKKKN